MSHAVQLPRPQPNWGNASSDHPARQPILRFASRFRNDSTRNLLQGGTPLTDLKAYSAKMAALIRPDDVQRDVVDWTAAPERSLSLTDVRGSVPGGGVAESDRDKYLGKNIRADIIDDEMRRTAGRASETSAAAVSLYSQVRKAQGLPGPGRDTVIRSHTNRR